MGDENPKSAHLYESKTLKWCCKVKFGLILFGLGRALFHARRPFVGLTFIKHDGLK